MRGRMRSGILRAGLPLILAYATFAGGRLLPAASPANGSEAPFKAVAFPGPNPGPAKAGTKGGRLRLENRVLAAEWSVDGGALRLMEFVNRLDGSRLSGVGSEMFAVEAPPLALMSADFAVDGAPRIETLEPEPKAARVAQRLRGRALVATLRHGGSGAIVEWRAELREGGHYIRQILILRGPAGAKSIRSLSPLCIEAAGAEIVGSVPGSPVASGRTFLGVELPMASARIEDRIVRWRMDGDIPWSPGNPCRVGAVIGVFPAGQMRRAFAAYMERERARESRPFLHYNCWYDLGRGLDERELLRVAGQFEEHLVRRRGIRLDSFVLDDGWDDPRAGFWAVDAKKFPGGFAPLRRDLARAGSHLGIWISPLAGYGEQQPERLQRAREAGLVPPDAGLSLDLPSYYDWWLRQCSAFIRDEGVNYFKWDNAADFTSLGRIAEELRKIDPSLFINTTVNTFPSPFFLNTMDATWRGGSDCGWFGPGNSREQYITYRDKELYDRVIRRAPLYPLNSIMHCAPVLGRHYQAAKIEGDMKNDLRALFAMGPVLQELYIGPELMTEASWDQLAEAVRWAHRNAGVLTDAHWIGGDPGRLEIYGCAAWSPARGTVMLRNPADKPAAVKLDIGRAFELPSGAARTYDLTAAYADQRVGRLRAEAGADLTLDLRPFEVLVFDAAPARKPGRR